MSEATASSSSGSTRPVAVVTGASAGIGAAIARELAARGNDVVVVARDAARLEALARELAASYGVEVEVLAADLIDASQLAKVEARVSDADRPIDVLVNNAGFGTAGDFATLDVAREESEIRLNVLALMRLTRAALPAMIERGHGGILNVASLASLQPTAHMAVYGATKAFVSSFTQAVHEEVRGTGVHVTVLCPGFTRTEFQERSGATASRVPDMAWQDAPEVARVGLDALARNSSVAVPGAMNKVAAVMSDISPTVLTRRVAALLGKYYET